MQTSFQNIIEGAPTHTAQVLAFFRNGDFAGHEMIGLNSKAWVTHEDILIENEEGELMFSSDSGYSLNHVIHASDNKVNYTVTVENDIAKYVLAIW